MTLRKLLKIVFGLLLFFAVVIGFTSLSHPIILKWVTGSARHIGKPIEATVYTDGQINNDIKVFYINRYWNSSEKARNYLLSLTEYDSLGMLKYININLIDKWIGRPIATTKTDYDFIAGHLFQSETGDQFALFHDNIKGFNFDPKLSFTNTQINFTLPPNILKFDSIRIELQ